MGDFVTTRQQTLWPDKKDAYDIKSPLLCAAMGAYNKLDSGQKFHGFNNGKLTVGYALLLYIAHNSLNIMRDKLNQDRIMYHPVLQKKLSLLLGTLPNSELDFAFSNFKELCTNTQNQLLSKKLSSVYLKRHVSSSSYASEIIRASIAAKLLSINSIEIYMDLLNSYTCSNSDYSGKGAEGSGITLALNIPSENILYCSNLVSCNVLDSPIVERNEWVVITNNPSGTIVVPVDSIFFDESKYKHDIASIITITDAKKELGQYTRNRANHRYPVFFPPQY